MSVETHWDTFQRSVREVELFDGIMGTLHWDQQTQMPAAGAAERGAHQELLARLRHATLTSDELGQAIEGLLEADLDEVRGAGVRNVARVRGRAVRLPDELVGKLSALAATGFGAWMTAREGGSAQAYLDHLAVLVDLLRAKAEYIDPGSPAYDVLVDEYDPGVTGEALEALFARLGPELVRIVEAVGDRPEPPRRLFDVTAQARLSRHVAQALGYDFGAGRLDVSEHPFTVGIGQGDVRITSRYSEDDLVGGLGGTTHETGHALYEQGLPRDQSGFGTCMPASVGVHESQSRFWENIVCRSHGFMEWLEPQLPDYFDGAALSADTLFVEANHIARTPIRVYADEVTYNLHIQVRVELELALVQGRLQPADLEEAWNERYRSLLGIVPETPVQGYLQDVHWATGAFGYFPSYTLGNLYSASLRAAMLEQSPTLFDGVARGEFGPILAWLRDNVHKPGGLRLGEAAVRHVVGDRDLVATFVDYLRERHCVTA